MLPDWASFDQVRLEKNALGEWTKFLLNNKQDFYSLLLFGHVILIHLNICTLIIKKIMCSAMHFFFNPIGSV